MARTEKAVDGLREKALEPANSAKANWATEKLLKAECCPSGEERTFAFEGGMRGVGAVLSKKK